MEKEQVTEKQSTEMLISAIIYQAVQDLDNKNKQVKKDAIDFLTSNRIDQYLLLFNEDINIKLIKDTINKRLGKYVKKS